VAVDATLVGQPRILRGGVCSIINAPVMSAVYMAALTKHRQLCREHLVVVRSVWDMAGEAVFLDGGVSPKKGSPFFGVAFKTELVDTVGRKQFISRAPMRVMAIGAGHFPFQNWHG
jgi:hypothetical protein